MRKAEQLIIGLPKAGKTTFLAALWHVIDQPEISTSLVKDGFPLLREYLNRIRDEWIAGRVVGRTPYVSRQAVTLQLKKPTTGDSVELKVPDLSGELFALQLSQRRWSEDFDRLATTATGILLFVNPGALIEPEAIDDVSDLAALLGADNEPYAATATEEWDHQHVPSQVQLMELIQFLRWRRPVDKLNIALVVSAWDMVGEGVEPAEWTKQRLPLLHQYILTNADWLTTRIYGVSAQGGTYSPETVQALLDDHPRAATRILVTGPDCNDHDITEPINWLLSVSG